MITSLIFFPEKTFYEMPADYQMLAEDVTVQTADKVDLFGWYFPAEKEKGVMLFFHGNAGNISGRIFKAKGWVDRGFSVFLIDYRGYGKSKGSIQHGDDIIRDAEAALNWLREEKKVALNRIILFGESLGTYPATFLATKEKVAAVILEAPFTSFVELGEIHYGGIPGFIRGPLMQDFAFPNIEHIAQIKSPLFILHGNQDETCPYRMGESIFELAPDPKGFFSIPGGSHNDLPMAAGEDYWEKPYEFMSKYLNS